MHRVELKGLLLMLMAMAITSFLMHRVELKVDACEEGVFRWDAVPNAPCGVERPILLPTAKPEGSS